jgi:hypothetical protein
MITTKEKDDVLRMICEQLLPEHSLSLATKDLIREAGIRDFETLHAILTYFKRIGLILEYNGRRQLTSIVVKVDAHDFLKRGGFHVQEELFLKNIEKLVLEIEKIKPAISEDIQVFTNISTITSAILTGLNFLKP